MLRIKKYCFKFLAVFSTGQSHFATSSVTIRKNIFYSTLQLVHSWHPSAIKGPHCSHQWTVWI